MLAACFATSGQTQQPPPTRAGLVINARLAVAIAAPCDPLHATYRLTPEGAGDPVAETRDVPGALTEGGGRKFCQYQTIAVLPGSAGLAPGRWRIELASFGACTVSLTAGGNSVYFSSASQTCSTRGFP